jgi:hypothetical protein
MERTKEEQNVVTFWFLEAAIKYVSYIPEHHVLGQRVVSLEIPQKSCVLGRIFIRYFSVTLYYDLGYSGVSGRLL